MLYHARVRSSKNAQNWPQKQTSSNLWKLNVYLLSQCKLWQAFSKHVVSKF